MSAAHQDFAAIRQHYLSIKTQQPKKYAREIASQMGLSEGELAHARVGHDAVRLQGEMRDILAALEAVGDTKCLCRNDYAIHEQIGRFTNLRIGERVGLTLNPRALDLRLFIDHWGSAFSLYEESPLGESQSIQFFDHQGDALLKVYRTENSDKAMWAALIDRFSTPENPPLALTHARSETLTPNANAAALDGEWRAMTDVHQFTGLLKKFQLSRQQAFRLVDDELACLVSNDTLATLLERVQRQGNEIMIFVGNRGCVQIFTGVLEKLVLMNGWINIVNRNFTLRLRDTEIAESWITRKPTADGHVTSLELFAKDGTQIAQLFGQRSEGQPEQSHWRAQVDALARRGQAA